MEETSSYNSKPLRYAALFAEYGVYLYVFFLFFDAGQSLREIGMYGALLGWLVLAVLGRGARPRMNLLLIALACYLLSVLASSVLSIKPAYSLKTAWGDMLPAVVMFGAVSATFDKKRLMRLAAVLSAAGLVLLVFGLHGFMTGKNPLYTSTNSLLSADKNKYGFYLGYTLPFFLLFFASTRKLWARGGWGALSLWTLAAGVLSRSRGSLGNMLAGVLVWGACFMNRKNLKYAVIAVVGIAVLVTVSLPFWPAGAKETLAKTSKDLRTMNLRTDYFWKPALEAVEKRPVFGWGYGPKVYRDPRPFEGTAKPNWELSGGLHSEFVHRLFSLGAVGLTAYLFLLGSGCYVLIRLVRGGGAHRDLAASLLAVLVGSFMVNALVKVTTFSMLCLILGMAGALAAMPSEKPEAE